jgi:TonB family protein
MTKIKNITLEFSCIEQKDSFDKIEKGFFCDKCSNIVIDFTDKSFDELQTEISNSTRPVCGVFKRSQLSEQFIRYATATFIATSALTIPSYGQVKVDSALKAIEHLEREIEEDTFFGSIVEVQAEPIGGYKKFFDALANEIKYPNGLTIRGKTFVQFTIDTTGRMSDIKIVKGLTDLADQEAIRALKTLDYPFTPGRQRNKPVKTKMVMPVVFDKGQNKRR